MSALCCVLFEELEAGVLREALASPERKLMSAVNALEVDVVPFDASLAEVAQEAWRRFGKGRHSAGLNFADCAAYALAKVTNQPLLFKGDDFTKTDIVPAVRTQQASAEKPENKRGR